MFRIHHEWVALLAELQVLWIHDENPKRPHAILTSGLHSNGFFNGGRLLYDHTRFARELCFDFVDLMVRAALEPSDITIDRVIGPAYGAITLADKLADALDVGSCFALPEGTGSAKKFVLEKRFNIKGKNILACEDTITTGGSVESVIMCAENREDERTGAYVLPIILALCNRSGEEYVGGRKVVAMFDKKMPTWEQRDCPYCKMGSEPLRAKENWGRLTANYN